MPFAARIAAHGAAGEALEHVYRGAIESHLPELAHHFLSAAARGDLPKAVDYAQRAAQRALDNLAYEQAGELFARALDALDLLGADVPRRAALLLGLGTAQSRAGLPAARASFENAMAAARSIDAHETFARAALGAAPFALTPGFVDDAYVALLGEALERIGPGDDPLRVRLLGSLATALYWSDTAPRRVELAQEALAMARRLGDDVTLVFALSSAQLATCGPDMTEQGLEWLRTLFALSERAGETTLSLDARSRHVDLLLELDDLAGADTAIETAERLATAARDRRAMAFVPLQRARRVTTEGRLEEARTLLAGVESIGREMPGTTVPLSVDSQTIVLDWVQRGAGSIGDAVRRYADAVPAMPVWRAALAAALAATGRTAEARMEFERLAAGDFAALPRDNLWLGAMAALTEAASSLGLGERALELHAKLAPFAGRNIVTPTVAFLGPVEMWLGILARVGGRGDDALAHLARARTAATRNGDRMSLGRILVEEAAVLADHGGSAEAERARELLAQAAAEATQLGRTELLDQIAQLRGRLAANGSSAAVLREAAPAPAPAARRAGPGLEGTHAARRRRLDDRRRPHDPAPQRRPRRAPAGAPARAAESRDPQPRARRHRRRPLGGRRGPGGGDGRRPRRALACRACAGERHARDPLGAQAGRRVRRPARPRAPERHPHGHVLHLRARPAAADALDRRRRERLTSITAAVRRSAGSHALRSWTTRSPSSTRSCSPTSSASPPSRSGPATRPPPTSRSPSRRPPRGSRRTSAATSSRASATP